MPQRSKQLAIDGVFARLEMAYAQEASTCEYVDKTLEFFLRFNSHTIHNITTKKAIHAAKTGGDHHVHNGHSHSHPHSGNHTHSHDTNHSHSSSHHHSLKGTHSHTLASKTTSKASSSTTSSVASKTAAKKTATQEMKKIIKATSTAASASPSPPVKKGLFSFLG